MQEQSRCVGLDTVRQKKVKLLDKIFHKHQERCVCREAVCDVRKGFEDCISEYVVTRKYKK
jgi:hypothetical protein